MQKKEMKNATDSEIIMDLITSYSSWTLALNIPRYSAKRIGEHVKDLENEALKRNILTQEQIERLNM